MRAKLLILLSTTALVVAVLGTTPLAAIAQNAAFPPGSVGNTQLKRNAVTAAKLAPNAVRTAHVLDGSLLASDFKPGQVPQGPKGDKGDRGEPGSAGLSEYEIVEVVARSFLNSAYAEAVCPGGKRVLAGGIRALMWSAGNGPHVYASHPNPTGTGWIVKASSGGSFDVYAVCARVS